VDYIAKNEAGLIFDNSLEKGKPNDIRVTGDPTSSLVIPGARRDPRPSSD
jgi:peptidylprolyl isomerase